MEPSEHLLGGRDVVVVAGGDAETYLQSQLSQDVSGMEVGGHRWTFVLEPSGRVDGFGRVTRVGSDRFEIDTDAGFGESLADRLRRFMIRVDATVGPGPSWPPTGDPDRAEADRVEAGWPRLGAEIIPGESIPAGTGLTGLAVSFTKGCYPGQELVERMDSRGATAPRTVRRLIVPEGTDVGAPVVDGDREVGVVTSVAGSNAMGWVARTSEVGTEIEWSRAE